MSHCQHPYTVKYCVWLGHVAIIVLNFLPQLWAVFTTSQVDIEEGQRQWLCTVLKEHWKCNIGLSVRISLCKRISQLMKEGGFYSNSSMPWKLVKIKWKHV
jgi:hypothetical protein